MKTIMEIIDRIAAANIELPVIWDEEASGYQFTRSVNLICDRSDAPAIKEQEWHALKDSLGNVTLYKDVGTVSNQHYLCLGNWLLGLYNNVFVEHKNGNTTDFRRSNLRRA